MDNNQMIVHFAKMAFDDALSTGENQIFLSASSRESEVIRKHIVHLANLLGVVAIGEPMTLPSGAKMIFLHTSSRTIAGYCGHTYALNCFDESNFTDVKTLVSSLAILKKHRAVFYSSES